MEEAQVIFLELRVQEGWVGMGSSGCAERTARPCFALSCVYVVHLYHLWLERVPQRVQPQTSLSASLVVQTMWVLVCEVVLILQVLVANSPGPIHLHQTRLHSCFNSQYIY